jgi:RNA polymerase sigma-70 factor (ECF subfamily)
VAAPAAGADDVVHARRLGEQVERELAALPERQRAALWLTAVDGLSYAEVAQALDVSETAVKALVHRARASLAERLGPEGAPPAREPGAAPPARKEGTG